MRPREVVLLQRQEMGHGLADLALVHVLHLLPHMPVTSGDLKDLLERHHPLEDALQLELQGVGLTRQEFIHHHQ